MKKLLAYFCIVAALAFLGSACDKPKPEPKPPEHENNPDDPNYCYPIQPVAMTFDGADALMLLNSEISFQIIYPQWLVYDHIGGFTPISLAAIDTEGAPILLQLKANMLYDKQSGLLTPKLTYESFSNIFTFASQIDSSKDVALNLDVPLGNLSVTAKDAAVFQPFTVEFRTYVNGALYDTSSYQTDLAELMVGYLQSTFYQISDDCISGQPDQRRNAITNKLQAMASMLRAGNAQGAYQKLSTDIMAKFDGANGGTQSDDWVSCQVESSNCYNTYQKILNVLDLLKR